MSQTSAAIGTESTPFKGIAYLVFGLSVFSIQDVIVKQLSGAYPVHEIVFLRCVIGLAPILLIVYLEGRGWRFLKTRRPVMQTLRGLFMFASYTTYYLAMATLPLADTATLFYSSPLFVTALAVPFLGEKVGFRRWVAVLVGFLGIVVVTRPTDVTFEPAMMLGIASALTYAVSVILTRRLSGTEAGSTLAFYAMVAFIGASGLVGLTIGDGQFASGEHPSMRFLLRAWTVPTAHDLGLIAICGLIAGIGFYCLSQAYRIASASTVSPFEYSSLPWAVLWGYLFFAELPSVATLMGLLLIAGSGLYIIHREGVRGRRVVRGRPLRHKI